MDKKWFIHCQGQQEGPVSVDEIIKKIGAGKLTTKDHAWCEGMENWQKIEDIPSLRAALSPGGASRPGGTGKAPAKGADDLSALIEIKGDEFDDSTGQIDPRTLNIAQKEAAKAEKMAVRAEQASGVGARKVIRLLLILLLLAGVLLGVGMVAYKMGRLPGFVEDWIKIRSAEIPAVRGTSAMEYRDLQLAAGTKLAREGPTLSLALTQTPDRGPVFYLASNLPDDTQFEIYLSGELPDLIGKLRHRSATRATLKSKLAEAAPLPDGQTLPPGRYRVFVYESPKQSVDLSAVVSQIRRLDEVLPPEINTNPRLLISKPYYLLGPLSNEDYRRALSGFHSTLAARALEEEGTIRTWLASISEMLKQAHDLHTALAAPRLTRKDLSLLTRGWRKAGSQWTVSEKAIREGLKQPLAENLQERYYYNDVYKLMVKAREEASKLYGLVDKELRSARPGKSADSNALSLAFKGAADTSAAVDTELGKMKKILPPDSVAQRAPPPQPPANEDKASKQKKTTKGRAGKSQARAKATGERRQPASH